MSGEPRSGSLNGWIPWAPLSLESQEPPLHPDTHPARLWEADHRNLFEQALPTKQPTLVVEAAACRWERDGKYKESKVSPSGMHVAWVQSLALS